MIDSSISTSRTLLYFILLGSITACARSSSADAPGSSPSTSSSQAPSNPAVIITVGESAQEFHARMGSRAKMDRQPAGLNFVDVSWKGAPDGFVHVDHGRYSFDIPHAMSLLASEDSDLPDEGLDNFSINASIGKTERISHEDARSYFYDLLGKIDKSGWSRVIGASAPRLRGRERFVHTMATSNINGLDADYVPTLEEWMRIDSMTYYSFFADGVYLDIYFRRDPIRLDADQSGVYLLTFKLTSEEERLRGYVESSDRPHWRSVIMPVLDNLKSVRAHKENELRKQGVQIDETYIDPPLPDLKGYTQGTSEL